MYGNISMFDSQDADVLDLLRYFKKWVESDGDILVDMNKVSDKMSQ